MVPYSWASIFFLAGGYSFLGGATLLFLSYVYPDIAGVLCFGSIFLVLLAVGFFALSLLEVIKSTFIRFACPQCHSRRIVRIKFIPAKCPDCGLSIERFEDIRARYGGP